MRHLRLRTAVLPLLAVLALVAAPAPAAGERDPRSDFDRDFSRTLPVKPGQRLEIEHSQGAIRITTHKLPEIRVKARISVSSSDADGAQKFGDGIVITVEDSGGAIVVRTKYPEKNWSFIGSGHVSFSVDYDIVVPETMGVSARNKFGDISVDRLMADATLSAANGSVRFRDGKGSQRLDATFGSVEIIRNAGPVDVTGANGSVVVAEIGGSAVIRNRFGSITARKIQGRTEIMSANGGIEIADITGELKVTNSFGNVEAIGVTGDASIRNTNGPVNLETVSGEAEIEGSFGKVRASKIKKGLRVRSQNGEISAADIDGPASLRTSFGLVEADRVKADLTVENSNGSVRASAIGGAASVRTSFAQVLLNGVGGRIDVDNSNGSIEVHAQPAKGAACASVSLKNSFGPIRVFLPENVGYTVDARTSFGKIRTELPMTMSGSSSADILTGRLGDGKCALTLVDANGNIELQKGN